VAASSRGRLGAALTLAVAGAACSGNPAAGPASAAQPGLTIEVTDTRGAVQWLAAQRGKPVLVNFWATWCSPCLAELPDLLAGTREFRARGGVVVGIALEQLVSDITADEARAKVQKKAQELGLDFPLLVCTDDEMPKIRAVLGVELGGLPQTLLYDRAGKLVHQHEGAADADEFRELAQRAER